MIYIDKFANFAPSFGSSDKCLGNTQPSGESSYPKSFDAMHWHNDMPGLSKGAVLLAYSEGCPRQVVQYSDRAHGLQCHLEMTAELVKGMVEHCAGDLRPRKYAQEKKNY